MKVRRALVDAGSGVNIIPTHIFLELGGYADQIRPTQVGLNAFNGVGVKSRGYVNAVSEVGPIKTNNKFYVVDGIEALATTSYWDVHGFIYIGEAHLVDASFYEELALPGVNKIRPVWEYAIETPRQKAVRKNTLMEEAPKESTKKQATAIENLGLRKEILPGGGYRRCIL
ncbi:hypothetical protein AHAS_AhasUnG0025600 [Arachis hypogaea]